MSEWKDYDMIEVALNMIAMLNGPNASEEAKKSLPDWEKLIPKVLEWTRWTSCPPHEFKCKTCEITRKLCNNTNGNVVMWFKGYMPWHPDAETVCGWCFEQSASEAN